MYIPRWKCNELLLGWLTCSYVRTYLTTPLHCQCPLITTNIITNKILFSTVHQHWNSKYSDEIYNKQY